MYEDTPQELVHDLFSEAVFGAHPLGRPGDRDRRGHLVRDRRRSLSAYHRAMYVAGNIVVAAAGNIEHEQLVALARSALEPQRPPRRSARVRAPLVQGAAAGPPLPAEGHRAVPRLRRRARHRALRPAPLRRVAPRLDPRRLRLVAALPGDPREARHGLLGLHVRLPVHRHRPDRVLRRHARGEPAGALEIAAEQIADIADGNLRAKRAQRAKENLKGRIMLSMESTSSRMSRLGKSLITDTELLSLDRIVAEIDAVEPRRSPSSPPAARAGALSVAGIGPKGSGSPMRSSASTPASRRAPREARPQRAARQGRPRARARARSGRARAGRRARRRPRRWSTSPRPTRSRRT